MTVLTFRVCFLNNTYIFYIEHDKTLYRCGLSSGKEWYRTDNIAFDTCLSITVFIKAVCCDRGIAMLCVPFTESWVVV